MEPTLVALAIWTVLTQRTMFRLALQQTEGLIGPTLRLVSIPVYRIPQP
jgi:hypothetical protein